MKRPTRPVALTIAGSDPSGGAGIQADIKTFEAWDVFGTTALSLLTVQNTAGVSAVELLAPELVIAQLDAVIEDMPPAAIKTGALGSHAIIEAVAARLAASRVPIVVDTVMVSKHGHSLLDDDAVGAIRDALIPRATLITPNVFEAAKLLDIDELSADDIAEAAKELVARYHCAVIITGGSVQGQEARDVLATHDGLRVYAAPWQQTRNVHGSGCTFSAAICAGLAHQMPLESAVDAARAYVTRGIAAAPALGQGPVGPLLHRVRADLPR